MAIQAAITIPGVTIPNCYGKIGAFRWDKGNPNTAFIRVDFYANPESEEIGAIQSIEMPIEFDLALEAEAQIVLDELKQQHDPELLKMVAFNLIRCLGYQTAGNTIEGAIDC